MASAEKKSVNSPDETRTFDNGKVELVNIGGGVVGRGVLEPGWKWSENVKPIAKTEWCEAPHFQYTISGRAIVRMTDGTEIRSALVTSPSPPGHDAWVVGDEPWVSVDWSGLAEYAKTR